MRLQFYEHFFLHCYTRYVQSVRISQMRVHESQRVAQLHTHVSRYFPVEIFPSSSRDPRNGFRLEHRNLSQIGVYMRYQFEISFLFPTLRFRIETEPDAEIRIFFPLVDLDWKNRVYIFIESDKKSYFFLY